MEKVNPLSSFSNNSSPDFPFQNFRSDRKKVWVEAFGCSANIADSEIIKGILCNNGYELTPLRKNSDINVLVTCAVKDATEHRMISKIKKYSKEKPLVVAGCLPKTSKNLIESFSPNSSLMGPQSLDKTLQVVDSSLQGQKVVALDDSMLTKVNLPRLRLNPVVSIMEISSGCLSECSFCQTKLAKGTLRSYRIGEIVRQMEDDLAANCKEIWLTSTDNGCYGMDLKTDLVDLLENCSNVEGDFKIRVGMMNPMYVPRFLERLISLYRNNDRIFKFLHMPVQSGSERILRKMKRGHTAKIFLDVVRELRKKIPEITIATDIITGFPSESERDFEETLNLIEASQPDVINSSKYSPRPGTVASKYPKISTEIVKERSARLHDTIKKTSMIRNQMWHSWKGKILIDEILDNGKIQGRNYAYRPVIINSPGEHKFDPKQLLGQYLSAKVVKVSNYSLIGELIS
ncbi:MAG TPA: tRNA (N(6)-L-threonylcarbamoyladenosine(37)-C(2))-methylthiotransferase [Nitrososphaeraceae archaeon]|nr:tRNA (N(6)-L-threonylcarbamoyladenosine(37)-C(2))-methylthiotransferase [Nitrososphaeraceae archaeon]